MAEPRGGNYVVSMDESVRNLLRNLSTQKERAGNKALREGAKYMASVVEDHTPVGPEPRRPDKYGPHTPYSMTRLKDDVKWQKRKDSYVVGYGRDTHWRAVFVNNGTINITPQFFFEKAIAKGEKGTVYTIQKVALEEMSKIWR